MSARGEGGGSGRRGPGAGRPDGGRRAGDVAAGNPREPSHSSVVGSREPNAAGDDRLGPGDPRKLGVPAGDVGPADPHERDALAAANPRGSGSGRSSAAASSPRRRRAVVRLSRLDAERLARGEISSPEEALHLDDPKATRSAMREERHGVVARDAGERRLLENRPPHFGSL